MNKRLKDSNFRVLYETDKLVLGHEFEYAYLISKKDNNEVYLGGFYGDPSCGLISGDNDWCLVGGEMLVVWRKDETVIPMADENLRCISEARQISTYEAELLIDPYSEKGAVWKLNISTREYEKLKDFKIEGEYSDQFDW